MARPEFPFEEKFSVINHPKHTHPTVIFSKTSDHARLVSIAVNDSKMSKEDVQQITENNLLLNGGRIRHARQEVQFDAIPTQEQLDAIAEAMKKSMEW